MSKNINLDDSPNIYREVSRRIFYLAWIIMVVLGIYYTIRGIDRSLFPVGATAGIPMSVHIVTGATALLIGPVQFSKYIRLKWRNFHRYSGWIYILCVLLSFPMTYILGYRSTCQECIPPFFIWSTVWMLVTAIAILMALKKRFEIHKQFMIRSYVLLNGFVFTRIDEFLPFPLPEGPEIHRPSMIIWIVWVVPLLITEFFLSWLPTIRNRNRVR